MVSYFNQLIEEGTSAGCRGLRGGGAVTDGVDDRVAGDAGIAPHGAQPRDWFGDAASIGAGDHRRVAECHPLTLIVLPVLYLILAGEPMPRPTSREVPQGFRQRPEPGVAGNGCGAPGGASPQASALTSNAGAVALRLSSTFPHTQQTVPHVHRFLSSRFPARIFAPDHNAWPLPGRSIPFKTPVYGQNQAPSANVTGANNPGLCGYIGVGLCRGPRRHGCRGLQRRTIRRWQPLCDVSSTGLKRRRSRSRTAAPALRMGMTTIGSFSPERILTPFFAPRWITGTPMSPVTPWGGQARVCREADDPLSRRAFRIYDTVKKTGKVLQVRVPGLLRRQVAPGGKVDSGRKNRGVGHAPGELHAKTILGVSGTTRSSPGVRMPTSRSWQDR